MRLLEWYRQLDLKKIQPKSIAPYPGFEKSKKYLLFYQYTQLKQAEVIAWQELLQNEGKQVDCLVFFEGKEKDLPQDIMPKYICRSDLSWWGRPKNAAFKEVITKHYDVFIDLSRGNHIAAKYLRYGSDASLKVNFGQEKKPWSDLQLNFNLRTEAAAAQVALLKFLAFINK
jgi:hypothetical protein